MADSQAAPSRELTHPRLKENIWHIDPDADVATLITSRGSFEVGREDALRFLRMRSYCTGWNSTEEIAQRSGLPLSDVSSIVDSLQEVGVVCASDAEQAPLARDEVRRTLIKICALWSDELRMSYIGNEVTGGDLPKTVLIGWLVEMYHYIQDFPFAIEYAAKRAQGKLKTVLQHYANQEKGHEIFVLRTLVNMGLKADEVRNATPLLSTRTVASLMRQLFDVEPAATLLMAALVEAQEFDEAQGQLFRERLQELFGLPLSTFEPFFEHQKIDVNMGHAELLERNADLLDIPDRARLDQVINNLHDLKHAFELQSLEIKHYYGELQGKYFPRQPMRYAAL